MLAAMPTYTSEELIGRWQSSTTGFSHLATEPHGDHTIFGVKDGKVWRYPAFQFDADGEPSPLIGSLINALPDERGWSRVQWLLTPNALLNRLRPLDVWPSDPDAVIVAAQQAHWGARE